MGYHDMIGMFIWISQKSHHFYPAKVGSEAIASRIPAYVLLACHALEARCVDGKFFGVNHSTYDEVGMQFASPTWRWLSSVVQDLEDLNMCRVVFSLPWAYTLQRWMVLLPNRSPARCSLHTPIHVGLPTIPKQKTPSFVNDSEYTTQEKHRGPHLLLICWHKRVTPLLLCRLFNEVPKDSIYSTDIQIIY